MKEEKNWLVVKSMVSTHVVPNNDTMDHEIAADESCACGPYINVHGTVIHHSKDQREFSEPNFNAEESFGKKAN